MRRPRVVQPQPPERVLVRTGDIAWSFRSGGDRSYLWFDSNGFQTDGHKVPVPLVAMFVRALQQERFEVAIEPGDSRASRGTRQLPVVVIPGVPAEPARGTSPRHWMRWFEHWTHRAAIILISAAALVILTADLWSILTIILGDPKL